MIKSLLFFILILPCTMAMEVNKSEVENMLKSMQASGAITEQQAVEASKELKTLSDNEWNSIKSKGAVIASEHRKKYNENNDQNNLRAPAQNNQTKESELLLIHQQIKDIMNKR